MVAIGGATQDPGAFSSVAKNSGTFVTNIYNFIVTYNFDGLDLDWEFPGPADKVNFVNLLSALRTKFGTKYLITSAMSANGYYIGNVYDIPAINRYLDFYNVMTYDFHGSWENFVACNSPLYGSSATDPWSIDGIIPKYINAGATSTKVIMGIPFYANIYRLSAASNNKIGSSGYAVNQLPYSTVCSTVKSYITVLDAKQQCVYAFSGTNWISYENVDSVTIKSQYAKSKNLGGAMVWAISQDDIKNVCGGGFYPLISAINRVIRTPAVTASTTAIGSTTVPTGTITTTIMESTTTTPIISTTTAGGTTMTPTSGNVVCYCENWSGVDWTTFKFDVCTQAIYAFVGINYNGEIIDFDPGSSSK